MLVSETGFFRFFQSQVKSVNKTFGNISKHMHLRIVAFQLDLFFINRLLSTNALIK